MIKNDYMQVLDEALGAGGEILKKFYGCLQSYDTKSSERDLVTVADKTSEEAIRRVIRQRYPDHEILGEEQGLDAPVGAECRWIIDPLDGTTNFAHGIPIFAVSVALEYRGEIVAGGVYNPISGEKFVAEAGSGAHLNGKPIKVSDVSSLSQSLLVTGFPHSSREILQLCLRELSFFLGKVHGVLRLGAAALDMCYVGCSRLEVFWQRNLNPWDTAAGFIIVKEAGGLVTDFRGRKFSPYGKELVCSNGHVHAEFLRWLDEAHKTSDDKSCVQPK